MTAKHRIIKAHQGAYWNTGVTRGRIRSIEVVAESTLPVMDLYDGVPAIDTVPAICLGIRVSGMESSQQPYLSLDVDAARMLAEVIQEAVVALDATLTPNGPQRPDFGRVGLSWADVVAIPRVRRAS